MGAIGGAGANYAGVIGENIIPFDQGNPNLIEDYYFPTPKNPEKCSIDSLQIKSGFVEHNLGMLGKKLDYLSDLNTSPAEYSPEEYNKTIEQVNQILAQGEIELKFNNSCDNLNDHNLSHNITDYNNLIKLIREEVRNGTINSDNLKAQVYIAKKFLKNMEELLVENYKETPNKNLIKKDNKVLSFNPVENIIGYIQKVSNNEDDTNYNSKKAPPKVEDDDSFEKNYITIEELLIDPKKAENITKDIRIQLLPYPVTVNKDKVKNKISVVIQNDKEPAPYTFYKFDELNIDQNRTINKEYDSWINNSRFERYCFGCYDMDVQIAIHQKCRSYGLVNPEKLNPKGWIRVSTDIVSDLINPGDINDQSNINYSNIITNTKRGNCRVYSDLTAFTFELLKKSGINKVSDGVYLRVIPITYNTGNLSNNIPDVNHGVVAVYIVNDNGVDISWIEPQSLEMNKSLSYMTKEAAKEYGFPKKED